MKKRLAIVGVMGSGEDEHADKAESLGRWLAGQRVHLLTGAGKGVMEAASRGFSAVTERAGLVIGITPRSEASTLPPEGFPNPFVEIPILTHLPLRGASGTEPMSRNHINVLSSDVLIALPGGIGTASEAVLALRYRRPMIAYLDTPSDIPGLPDAVPVVTTLEEVQEFVRRMLGKVEV